MDPHDKRWNQLSPSLAQERSAASFMSILLDEEIVARATDACSSEARILDFGCGDGVLARAIAQDSGAVIDAFEPTESQRSELLAHLQSEDLPINVLSAESQILGHYDLILCVNVLDHIADWKSKLKRFKGWTRGGGRLILVLPHPLKDLGDWKKERHAETGFRYVSYVLQGYLEEGLCHKNREDRNGEVVARDLPSHHRTVSSYYNELCRLGFRVKEMLEPTPDAKFRDVEPVLYSKASRIPYFLMFDCIREA